MALISCPDCGKQFSDAAAACPNCGRPNKPASPAPAPKKKGFGCLSSGLIILVVVGIIGAIADSSKGRPPSPGASTTDHAYEDGVKTSEAEDKVKELLRDPGSASFRDEMVVRHQNGIAVCGQVNAKNGFGGFTGFTDFIVISSAVLRTRDNDAQFVRIWNKTCR